MHKFEPLRGQPVRLEELPNGVRPINWKLLDPYIRKCTKRGDVGALARIALVSHLAIRRRRRELKLKPIKAGRPSRRELNPDQHELLFHINRGKTMTEFAASKGNTVQAASYAKKIAYEKTKQCEGGCEGNGVVPCGNTQGMKSCNTNPHNHVCLVCGGEGRVPK